MRFKKIEVSGSVCNKIKILTILLLVTLLMPACSGVNIEAAKVLGVTGRNIALQTQQNVLVSDREYLRALDSEAFLHGFRGTTRLESYTDILKLYDAIQSELTKRSVVFEKLADLYDAFGELAGLDAGGQTEKALAYLGGAIEEYSKQIKQPSPIYSDTTAVISKIGGLIATEIQKAKIKEASIQIRTRVEDFLKLFEDPLVREQMTGFRKLLGSDRKTAFMILWDKGVYDPKPLLDDFGADAGLVAQKDVAALIKSNPQLGNAIKEVLDKRLARNQFELIEKGYNASLSALRHLISEHKKLEQGAPLDLARLRAIAAELRNIAVLLAKVKTDVYTKQ